MVCLRIVFLKSHLPDFAFTILLQVHAANCHNGHQLYFSYLSSFFYHSIYDIKVVVAIYMMLIILYPFTQNNQLKICFCGVGIGEQKIVSTFLFLVIENTLLKPKLFFGKVETAN